MFNIALHKRYQRNLYCSGRLPIFHRQWTLPIESTENEISVCNGTLTPVSSSDHNYIVLKLSISLIYFNWFDFTKHKIKMFLLWTCKGKIVNFPNTYTFRLCISCRLKSIINFQLSSPKLKNFFELKNNNKSK